MYLSNGKLKATAVTALGHFSQEFEIVSPFDHAIKTYMFEIWPFIVSMIVRSIL